jgi:hypothetical protein
LVDELAPVLTLMLAAPNLDVDDDDEEDEEEEVPASRFRPREAGCTGTASLAPPSALLGPLDPSRAVEAVEAELEP